MTRYIKGGRTMISLRFDPELLKELDAMVEKIGTTNRTELLEEAARMIIRAKGAKKPQPKR